MAQGKKKRASKTSKGIHGGGGKVTLTELQKVLMGGGAFQSLSHKADAEAAKRRAERRQVSRKK